MAAHLRLDVVADTYLSMNAPIQLALPVLLNSRRRFQKQVLARIKQNLSELDGQLAQQSLCSRLYVEGGWNVILRTPRTRSDEAFAVELLTKEGVYLHPGEFYDFPSEGHFVVSLLCPEEEFAEGLRRMLSAQ